jgi:hypothetical protein
MFGKKRAMKD